MAKSCFLARKSIKTAKKKLFLLNSGENIDHTKQLHIWTCIQMKSSSDLMLVLYPTPTSTNPHIRPVIAPLPLQTTSTPSSFRDPLHPCSLRPNGFILWLRTFVSQQAAQQDTSPPLPLPVDFNSEQGIDFQSSFQYPTSVTDLVTSFLNILYICIQRHDLIYPRLKL